MQSEFLDAFMQIVRVKKIDKNTLIETLKASLSSAAARKYGPDAAISVHIDEAKGNLDVFRTYQVVENVEDPSTEISLEKALEIDENAEMGKEIHEELDVRDFGRNAVQTAKQILTQRVKESERDRIYETYKDRIGNIVSGTVRQVDRGNILINLGRAEAFLPYREQIRKERYNQGDTIRACIINVDKDAKGALITVSRTCDELLIKLFEQEVPEIFDGDVEIRSVAREPGARSKIAVFSRNDKVDAVGSCVGMKGSRVQAVVNELHGEKIDIVNWSQVSSDFVTRALAPAKVSGLRFDENENRVLVIVEDDQLSLAIGKDGQNVRLASKLTGWKIDLATVRETERRSKLEQKLLMDIDEMYGVTENLSKKLRNAGILTVQKLYKTSTEELLQIDGIGEKTAEKLKDRAEETMEELDKAMEELLKKEIEKEEQEKKLFDEDLLEKKREKEGEEEKITEESLFGEMAGEQAESEEEPDGEGDKEAEEETGEDTGIEDQDGDAEEAEDTEEDNV
ncbi:MAG: transcription termination factor NusA [Candidatus Krumholzibacteriales bacterium]